MNLTVSKISNVTSTGNRILSLTTPEVEVKTPFGTKIQRMTYCMAVKEGTQPAVGHSADIKLSEYQIIERSNTNENGVIKSAKWLSLREVID